MEMTAAQKEQDRSRTGRREQVIAGVEGKAAILSAGVSERQIWTIDFNETVKFLKLAYEYEREKLYNTLGIPEYSDSHLPSYMHQSAGRLKLLVSKKESVRENVYSVFHEFLGKWSKRQELVDQAKKFSVKKPSKKSAEDAQRERYLAPKQSTENMQKVRDMLGDVINGRYLNLVKVLTDNMESRVESLKKAFASAKNGTDLDKIRNGYRDLYWHIFDVNQSGFGASATFKATLKPDHKKWMQASVKQNAEAIRDAFIYKNMFKLAAIIVGKEQNEVKVAEANVLFGTGVFRGTLEGEIRFIFSDKSSFRVRNQVVWKHRTYDFPQFPTTFHQVVFKSGKTVAMVPEKEMVEKWAKE